MATLKRTGTQIRKRIRAPAPPDSWSWFSGKCPGEYGDGRRREHERQHRELRQHHGKRHRRHHLRRRRMEVPARLPRWPSALRVGIRRLQPGERQQAVAQAGISRDITDAGTITASVVASENGSGRKFRDGGGIGRFRWWRGRRGSGRHADPRDPLFRVITATALGSGNAVGVFGLA